MRVLQVIHGYPMRFGARQPLPGFARPPKAYPCCSPRPAKAEAKKTESISWSPTMRSWPLWSVISSVRLWPAPTGLISWKRWACGERQVVYTLLGAVK